MSRTHLYCPNDVRTIEVRMHLLLKKNFYFTGCFVMYLFVVGSLKSYGILYTEIDEHFAVGSGPLAFIGSVILMCMLGLGRLIRT